MGHCTMESVDRLRSRNEILPCDEQDARYPFRLLDQIRARGV